MPEDFGPHLYRVELHPGPRLETFALKGFDVIPERDFVIGTATIIFPYNWRDTPLHDLTQVIHGDALGDRSGPALGTPGMGALEVGPKPVQPTTSPVRSSLFSRGKRVMRPSWGQRPGILVEGRWLGHVGATPWVDCVGPGNCTRNDRTMLLLAPGSYRRRS